MPMTLFLVAAIILTALYLRRQPVIKPVDKPKGLVIGPIQ